MTRESTGLTWPFWPDINVNLPSGNVTQDILREWFSQKFELNFAGNSQIETEVVAKVASYGKQLGILSDAVLELAGRKEGDAVARLEELVEIIDDIKQAHKKDLRADAKRALDTLKTADASAFENLIAEYRT